MIHPMKVINTLFNAPSYIVVGIFGGLLFFLFFLRKKENNNLPLLIAEGMQLLQKKLYPLFFHIDILGYRFVTSHISVIIWILIIWFLV